MEYLVMLKGCMPMGQEWVMWIPREENKAADYLADRAIQTRRDCLYLGRGSRNQQADLVVWSDAGLVEGRLGCGGLAKNTRSGEVVWAFSLRLQGTGRGDEEDINFGEMAAANFAVGMLLATRSGTLDDWAASCSCDLLPAHELEKLRRTTWAMKACSGSGTDTA